VTVNGGAFATSARGGQFHTLQKEWVPGDRIALHMPMPWRVVRGRQHQAGCGAVMRGPQLFCLDPSGQEALASVDLRHVAIDPASIHGPERTGKVRPDGLACRVIGWSPRVSTNLAPDLELVLTEFPDPGGRATYFRLPNPEDERLVEDELLRG
jgi:hypothetical protein